MEIQTINRTVIFLTVDEIAMIAGDYLKKKGKIPKKAQVLATPRLIEGAGGGEPQVVGIELVANDEGAEECREEMI